MADSPVKEQPDVIAPDALIDPKSDLPAGIGAPDEELDSVLEGLDSDEEEIGLSSKDYKEKWDAEQDEDPEPIEDTSAESDTDEAEKPESEKQADEEEKPDRDELEKAIAALKRDGLDASLIDKMTNSEIIELGEKRAKVQGDADNAYRELSELKKQQEMAPESETESPALAEPTDKPVSADLHTAIQPFADIFGDDAAAALRDYGEASVQSLRHVVESQSRMLEQVLLESSKGQLEDRFPQLADEEAFARVSTRMQSLAKTGEYSDVTSLMVDASRIEFSDESKEVSAEISNKRARHKAVGQMTPSGGSETPSHALSDDEREEALLDALEGGMSTREARQRYGSTEQP